MHLPIPATGLTQSSASDTQALSGLKASSKAAKGSAEVSEGTATTFGGVLLARLRAEPGSAAAAQAGSGKTAQEGEAKAASEVSGANGENAQPETASPEEVLPKRLAEEPGAQPPWRAASPSEVSGSGDLSGVSGERGVFEIASAKAGGAGVDSGEDIQRAEQRGTGKSLSVPAQAEEGSSHREKTKAKSHAETPVSLPQGMTVSGVAPLSDPGTAQISPGAAVSAGPEKTGKTGLAGRGGTGSASGLSCSIPATGGAVRNEAAAAASSSGANAAKAAQVPDQANAGGLGNMDAGNAAIGDADIDGLRMSLTAQGDVSAGTASAPTAEQRVNAGETAKAAKTAAAKTGSSAHSVSAAGTARDVSGPGSAASPGAVAALSGHGQAGMPSAGAGTGAQGRTSALPGGSTNNPFERLDQQAGASAARVLHAGPQSISVGVRDPGLGWVEIHTQSAAGQISAVMAAASTAAHTSLTAHLPSLSRFLSEHDVPVGSLAVKQELSQGSGSPGGGNAYSGSADSGSSESGFTGAGADHSGANPVDVSLQHAGLAQPGQEVASVSLGRDVKISSISVIA